MSKNFTQQNVGLSVTAPVGEDVLILQTLNGEDRISGLFLYQLEMISEDPEVDMDAMVGGDFEKGLKNLADAAAKHQAAD